MVRPIPRRQDLLTPGSSDRFPNHVAVMTTLVENTQPAFRHRLQCIALESLRVHRQAADWEDQRLGVRQVAIEQFIRKVIRRRRQMRGQLLVTNNKLTFQGSWYRHLAVRNVQNQWNRLRCITLRLRTQHLLAPLRSLCPVVPRNLPANGVHPMQID